MEARGETRCIAVVKVGMDFLLRPVGLIKRQSKPCNSPARHEDQAA